MSRLNVLSWLASGFVHTLAFALLGTLLTQATAEQPDFFVPLGNGNINVDFSPPPRQTEVVEIAQPLKDDTIEFPLPQSVPVEDELPPVEEVSEEVAESEPELAEPPAVIEEPLPPTELLAMSELAMRPLEIARRPPTSTRRRPATPPTVTRRQTATRQPEKVEATVSQVAVVRTIEREPEPQLKMVDATPTQRQTREIDAPPVTTAEESETEARQREVAGSEQSRPPRAIRNPAPNYPREAIRRRLEGTVKLRVQIGLNGQVQLVSVAESSGYAMLDESALKAIRGWKFSPRLQNGKPVASSALIPIRFHFD
jgi:protein TonB